MSLNKFKLTQVGEDIKLNVGCQDLKANGVVNLKGNVIPLSTATAGSVLVNSNGAGALQWSSGPPSSGGSYSPVYAFPAGGSLINAQVSPVMRVGNVVIFSGSISVNLPGAGTSMTLEVSLPPGSANTANNNQSAQATGHSGNPATQSVVNYDMSMDATKLTLYLINGNGSAFAGTTSIVHYTCQFVSTL